MWKRFSGSQAKALFVLALFTFIGIEAAPESPLYKVGNRVHGWNDEGKTDHFLNDVQPILTKRCVACHGCYEAPCQLNLQSYEGLRRGFNPEPIYSGKRIEYVHYTPRPGDSLNPEAWRSHGFLPVLDTKQPVNGLLYQFVKRGTEINNPPFALAPYKKLQDAYENDQRQCVATSSQFEEHFKTSNPHQVISFEDFVSENQKVGMPFGLPALDRKSEQDVLLEWARAGAVGPSAEAKALLEKSARPDIIASWEGFLNDQSAQGIVTGRYIFEHVFSATIFFEEIPGEYYDLIRSKSAKGAIEPVVTDLPYRDPQVKQVFYRFKKATRAITQKTQNIWRLSETKLAHLKKEFHSNNWQKPIYVPDYETVNVFQNFRSIPAMARARFMQENSRLIVGAMVQGTVCIGVRATYAIADHFWAWFLKPEMDPSVQNPSLGIDIAKLATAPAPREPWKPKTIVGEKLLGLIDKLKVGEKAAARFIVSQIRAVHQFVRFHVGHDEGDDLLADAVLDLKKKGLKAGEIVAAVAHLIHSIEANRDYQEAFEKQLRVLLKKKSRANLTLEDLWTGDGDPVYAQGDNPNAWLNITRHEVSASVQFGPEGGIPQSIWIMSYSNFERLYYNLVASFEVWGSITHKLATWRHMSYVRLEGEDLAISLLPIKQRKAVREWFTHSLGGIANEVFFPLQSVASMDLPVRSDANADPSLRGSTPYESVEKYVEKMSAKLSHVAKRGQVDAEGISPSQQAFEKSLFALQKKTLEEEQPYARALPNITYLRVQGPGDEVWYYTLHADRGYKGHNLVLLEKESREPKYDGLAVYRGMVGAYPNLFIDVSAKSSDGLVGAIRSFRQEGDVTKLAIARNQPTIWEFFDQLHLWKSQVHPGNDPVEQGVVDMSQYLFF